MANKANVKKESIAHRTSIGNSSNTRPKNKHTKRMYKPYRGQGKP